MKFDYLGCFCQGGVPFGSSKESDGCAYDDCVGELMANSSLISSTKHRILTMIEVRKPDTYYKAIRHIVRRSDIIGSTMINLVGTINDKFSKV